MTVHVKLRELPIEADTSAGAIKAVFTTMPAADQVMLPAELGPAPSEGLEEQIAAGHRRP
jgi:hypothetical protein